MGVRGRGQDGYVFCFDNLYYGFFLNPLCLFIITNLNAFVIVLVFFLHVDFKLTIF